MIMVTTVQQALRPYFIICFIIGLGFYPKKQSRIWWIAYLKILYPLTIWFAYAYVFYYIVTFFTIKVLFRSIVIIVVTVINIITSIVSMIMSFYHQKRFTTCLKKLAIVDETLEDLGNPKIYKKIHMWSKGMVIVWIMCSLAENFYEMSLWQNLKETASWALYLPHVLNYSRHINDLVDLLFIFFLWYIGTRFDKVNEHIRYLSMKGKQHQICTSKKSVIAFHQYILHTDNYKRILWTLMHLHLELCRLARELNLIFGTQMTFDMASYLLYLTALYYYLCVMLMQEHPEKTYSANYWFNIGLCVFLFSFKLYIVNYICENVMIKANKIDKIIHQLTSIRQYADVWEEISQFTLQTMQHPLKFSGMGLFFFGNGFLRKFCMTVITFVIIMMQLKIP